MKKIMILAMLMVMTITANAMSYMEAKKEALYLSDKMAWELSLTNAQYDAVYEINLDYMMSVNGRNDVMLYARSCLSKANVAMWLGKALTNSFWFSEKNTPGITTDKAAWVQTIVEQAVGRLCRTRNKPHITYILYDDSMTPYFDEANLHKSLRRTIIF